MTLLKPSVVGLLIVVGIGVGFGSGYFFRNQQLSKMRGNFAVGANAYGAQRFNGANRGMGQTGGQNGMMRGGTIGTILSVDDKSVTVKLIDGSSKIVLFSDSTTYSNTISSSKSDLKTGMNVNVMGTPNSDGSLTATNILLNPFMFKPQMSPVPQK